MLAAARSASALAASRSLLEMRPFCERSSERRYCAFVCAWVALAKDQRGVGGVHLRLGLFDARLQLRRVDLREHLTDGHVIVEIYVNFRDFPGNLRADVDRIEALQRAGGGDRLLQVAHLRGRGQVANALRLAALAAPKEGAARDRNHQQHADDLVDPGASPS